MGAHDQIICLSYDWLLFHNTNAFFTNAFFFISPVQVLICERDNRVCHYVKYLTVSREFFRII